MNEEVDQKPHWTLSREVRITEIVTIGGLIVAAAMAWASVKEDVRTLQVRQEEADKRAIETKSDLGRLIIDMRSEMRERMADLKADIRKGRD